MTNYRHISESPTISSMTKRSTSSLLTLSSSPSSSSSHGSDTSSSNFIVLPCSSSSPSSSEDDQQQEQKFSPRSSHHRSWSQQGRLWMLKSKRRLLLYKRLFMTFGTLWCTCWTLLSHFQSQFNTYAYNNNDPAHNLLHNGHDQRQLCHPIRPPKIHPLLIGGAARGGGGGYASLAQVGYSAKPMLMGFLWPSSSAAHDNHRVHKQTIHEDGYNPPENHVVVVSMDPTNFDILKAETIELQPPSGGRRHHRRRRRRSIVPPNYHIMFQPRPLQNRNHIVFDVNYTDHSGNDDGPRFEEIDEGMAWPIPEGCEPQYEWQKWSYPTCNTMHEQDVTQQLTIANNNDNSNSNSGSPFLQAALLAAGGYRNVWMIRNGTEIAAAVDEHGGGGGGGVQREPPIALKTLLYQRDWYQVQFERHNLDALASSQLQASPYILNMYGYCGTSGLYEFAQGDNLHHYMAQQQNGKHVVPAQTKMKLAYNVVAAITDLHNYVQEGSPWIAHTDIFPDQFLRVQGHGDDDDGGLFKLNDFNRARWLHKNRDTNETCGFTFPHNRGKFRSPEEYAYQPETEKVDVYSMGNILYVLLTGGEYPFEKHSRETVKQVLARGKRQRIPDIYKDDSQAHPLERALVEAIHMCWIHDPKHRATARQVEQFLRKSIKDYKEQARNQ